MFSFRDIFGVRKQKQTNLIRETGSTDQRHESGTSVLKRTWPL